MQSYIPKQDSKVVKLSPMQKLDLLWEYAKKNMN
jgi:hypothetical protein